MSRIAYVNGRYCPLAEASVNVEDRGYQFSDGVYEVCEVRGGRLIDERLHMKRLAFSLSELRIAMPMSPASLSVVLHEVVRGIACAGASSICRSPAACHAATMRFRRRARHRAIVVTARNLDLPRGEMAADGVAVPLRAGKSLGARRNQTGVAPAQRAGEEGRASRAPAKPGSWTGDGSVTEGSSSNAWIVTRDGAVVTRQANHAILRGITRTVLLEAIAAQGLKFEERAFTLEEAHAAREAFITSASQIVLPVVKSTVGRSAMVRRGWLPPRSVESFTATPKSPDATWSWLKRVCS